MIVEVATTKRPACASTPPRRSSAVTRRHALRSASFPARLAAARLAAGLSQAALAARLGVTRQTLSTWEDGSRGCTSDRVVLLCRTLGLSPAWLAFGADREPPLMVTDAEPWTAEGYGARLRQARAQVGRSLQQLGAELGFGPDHARKGLQAVEAERTRLDLALCERAAAILQVSPVWLAFGRAR